ncbi:uncharacterized protein LOC143022255 [Oratosquilla oratoria]|uniref:uncharacterized protein LOC143022255 n=1 Tax=Oratosquilla oratoria TaxID=337810 RepID=UPI003F75EE23
MEKLEQRYCIKFCVKLGDSQVETIRKIKQAFGDEAMGITQIKEWYRRFKGGRTSVESETRSGRPSTSRNETVINQLRTLVMQNRGITIKELANEVGVSCASVHCIMKEDLGFRKVAAKFVPKQKELHDELTKDEAGVSSAGVDSINSSVTDPVWSAQGKTLGRNKKVNGRGQHLRHKKKRTEQNSSDECLDGTDAEVYIDVAEHHEDLRKRKHCMDDEEELVSVSDGYIYIKSEDDVGVKIEISQEYLFDEPSGEQVVEKNRSNGKEFPGVNDGKTYNNNEYDYDNVKTENSQEDLFVESLEDQDNVKDKNEVEDVNLNVIKQEQVDEVIESNR